MRAFWNANFLAAVWCALIFVWFGDAFMFFLTFLNAWVFTESFRPIDA